MIIPEIEDALIADLKANIPDVRTVKTYESDYDDKTLSEMLVLSPFILIHYDGGQATDYSNGGEVFSETDRFVFLLGARSLRGVKESKLGAYALLAGLRDRLNGRTVQTIGGGVTPSFRYISQRIVAAEGGLVVYQATYSIIQ